jgi:hypothetical protein
MRRYKDLNSIFSRAGFLCDQWQHIAIQHIDRMILQIQRWIERTQAMSASLRLATIVFSLLPLLAAAQSRTPVLVELFTSEGCSSCPPADRLLATLSAKQPVNGAQIIVLEEHVDYWEGLGWHDRFSSSQYTTRQNLYSPRLRFDSPYTPQMVVDGTFQFVGNDPSQALSSIGKAAESPKIPLQLAPATIDGKHVSSTVSVAVKQSLPRGDVYAALVDQTASTEVKGGENGGCRLDHVSVVRSLQRIGKLQDLANGPIPFKLTAPTEDSTLHMNLVVFAQLPNQGAIRGAATIPTQRQP